MIELAIELRGLVKTFVSRRERVEAVRGLDLSVRRGEVYLLNAHIGAYEQAGRENAPPLRVPRPR